MTWEWYNDRAPFTRVVLALIGVFGTLYILGSVGVPHTTFLALVIALTIIFAIYQNRFAP